MKSAGATDEPFVYDSVLQGLSSCLDTYGIEPAATGILCPAFGLHLLAIEAAPAILSRRV